MDTIAAAIAGAGKRFGDAPALTFKTDAGWSSVTYSELDLITSELGRGLLDLGVQAGDRVCILADTRVEWTHADYALVRAGVVVVPIYASNSAEECAWVIGNSGARIVICENAAQSAKIAAVRAELPTLEAVLTIEPMEGHTSLADLRAVGRELSTAGLDARTAAVRPDDLWSIVYTSGTTGPAKGCMLTHAGMAAVCDAVQAGGLLTAQDRSFLYLPLAHMFARIVQLLATELGASVIYFGGDVKNVLADLEQTKPTFVPSVPRIFEKIYSKAWAAARESGGAKLAIFSWAVGVGRQAGRAQQEGQSLSPLLKIQHRVADRLVFAKVRGLFGGEVRNVLTGAAPIAPEILEFFYGAGISVFEGYGMTESSAAIAITPAGRPRFGTVGAALPGVQIRIADDGEVLAKGQNIFAGYFGNPDASAEAIIDGWLHTGDLGELDADGYLTITGRKKDIIITAGGKNLSPANLENDLTSSPWISHAVMHGDRRPFPVALITLDPEEIGAYAAERGLPSDMADLIETTEIRDLIQTELDAVNSKYAQVSQIKKFVLLAHDLSQEGGELTPTMKVKRNVVETKYLSVFDALYTSERSIG